MDQRPKLLDRRFVSGVYNLFIGALLYPLSLAVFAMAFALLASDAESWWSMAAGMAAVLLGPAMLASAVAALFSRNGRMTPGGKLVGLAVVDPGGGDIGFIRACLRYMLYGLCLLPLGAGVWWAAIDKEGRTCPDMAMGTRVVYRGGGSGSLPAVVVGLYGLGAAFFLCGLFVFVNLMGLFSFPEAAFAGMAAGLLGSVALMSAAVVIKIVHRKNEETKRIAGGAFTMAFLLFLGAVFAAATIPSNAAFVKAHRAKACRDELLKSGRAVERFIAEKGRQPKGWDELTVTGYLPAAPRAGDRELVLRFEAEGKDTLFVIEHPEPGQLLLPRGFRPAKPCKAMRYLRGGQIEVES